MAANETETLKNILRDMVSMELRVKTSEVKSTIELMDGYGLKYKNSWDSVELEGYTVIDFWRKDLIKSSAPTE
ncbi:hypothetical protein [Paenibacillus spongiae]|uniref:Uncharacterized protein n=1 Tax=Paenibacillus spongiae TaxID=2909671 RepID=A0ABY5S996_9BACL|nr:hypothetical protein [Paenibacillus spongiae]UVI30489.1 hypothetical protein L1F29_00930 [Paenibacillus spongiae]